MLAVMAGDKYTETRVLSATPEQLVVILYDHVLTQLQRARLAIEVGQDETRMAAMDRASKAVSELLLTLDRDRGGAIATQLDGLYSFLLAELVDIGIHPDVARLERLSAMVQELRDAFDAAARARSAGAAIS